MNRSQDYGSENNDDSERFFVNGEDEEAHFYLDDEFYEKVDFDELDADKIFEEIDLLIGGSDENED